MHLVTLSFDDGFARSCVKIADIHEKYGLSACFNVLAGAHLPEWVSPDQYMSRQGVGDFSLWRELHARGHEIAPHGYRHANKASLPFGEARDLILRCLDTFETQIDGFSPSRAVFNFPYNSSTPFLNQWLSTRVRAVRAGNSPSGINPLPTRNTFRLDSTSWGPGNIDAHLSQCVDALLAQPQGWLVYCLHGLDDEGYGPLSSRCLDRTLDRLARMPEVRVLPAGRLLEHVDLGRM